MNRIGMWAAKITGASVINLTITNPQQFVQDLHYAEARIEAAIAPVAHLFSLLHLAP